MGTDPLTAALRELVREAVAEGIAEALAEMGATPTRQNGRDSDRLLTAEQVAERMGFLTDDGHPDRRAIYRRAPDWPFASKVGAVWRFSERGLDRWLARR